jgi:hypothetical protein
MRRKKSIHRMLIIRLAVATVVIAALVAVAVIFAVRRDINELVIERALTAAAQFKGYIVDQLDIPGLGEHAKIQRALDRSGSSRLRLGLGEFVFVRILDGEFNEVARTADRANPHIAAVTKYAENAIDMPGLRTVIRF